MPRKCKNEYQKIDDAIMLLIITKFDGTRHKFYFNTWWEAIVKSCQWHVGAKGYAKTKGNLHMAEIIFHKKPPGMVWNHINSLKGDNRDCNLELVTDSVNKRSQNRKGKKDVTLPNGVSSRYLKNGEKRHMVRGLDKHASIPEIGEATGFRYRTLINKDVSLDTARKQVGWMTRAEYNDYWNMYAMLNS
jgi:hypothetical protein